MAYNSNQFPIEKYPTSYVVFDLETTGLSIDNDGILQIGAIRVVDGKETRSFMTYVDTDVPLSREAQKVNKITRSMIAGSPKTADAIQQFIDFVGDSPLIGYNSDRFDIPMLKANAARVGVDLPKWQSFDCMKVASSVYGRRSLKDICRYCVVTPGGHDALADARATWQCFEVLRQRIIAMTERAAVFGKPKRGPLSRYSIVFTGHFQSPSMHDLMQQAHDLGATLQDRVTLKTTHLVVLDNPGITKVQKAEEYNPRTHVQTVTYDQYAEEVIKEVGMGEPFEVVHAPAIEELSRSQVPSSYEFDESYESNPESTSVQTTPAKWTVTKILLVIFLAVIAIAVIMTWWPIIVGIIILIAIFWHFLHK